MANDLSYILKKSSCDTHVVKDVQPMTLTILLKDTVVTLHQLHPPPSNLLRPPIFYY